MLHFRMDLPQKKLKMPYLLGLVEIQEIPCLAASKSVARLLSFNQVLEMARLDGLPFKSSQELLD